MTATVRARLGIMMFGQYFVWGAWFVTLGTYMSAAGFGDVIGLTYANQGLAAIIGPLIVGSVADRYVSAQRLMGVLHILSGLFLCLAATVSGDPGIFRWLVFGHFLCYMPTLPLSNTVAFNAIENVQRDFPSVRVYGTIGWIVAGLIIGAIPGAARTNLPLLIAAGVSVLLGCYSFSLPATPPRARGQQLSLLGALGLDILAQKHSRSFIVFLVCSTLTTIPLAFYYAYTNLFLVDRAMNISVGGHLFEPAAIQTLGQVSELAFMLALPFFLARFGIKWVMVAGMIAWALRYVLFGFATSTAGAGMAMLLIGIMLHGVCYDFFFVAGQIYVDKTFDDSRRARAQSLLAFLTLGIGNMIGSAMSNEVVNANTVDGVHAWTAIWLVPAALAASIAALFATAFKQPRLPASTAR